MVNSRKGDFQWLPFFLFLVVWIRDRGRRGGGGSQGVDEQGRDVYECNPPDGM